VVHADATFKTNDFRFQLETIAVVDPHHRQHTLCHFVMSHKTTAEYAKVALALFDVYRTVFPNNPSFNPSFIMIDKEPAFANAMIAQYPDVSVLMCYFHMMKASLDRTGCKEFRKVARIAIRSMHYTKNIEDFNALLESFTQQCNADPAHKVFIDYFIKEWINTLFCNWRAFDGIVGGCCTNNTVESNHRKFKFCFLNNKKTTLNNLFIKLGDDLSQHGNQLLEDRRWNDAPRVTKVCIQLAKSYFKSCTIGEVKYERRLLTLTVDTVKHWFILYRDEQDLAVVDRAMDTAISTGVAVFNGQVATDTPLVGWTTQHRVITYNPRHDHADIQRPPTCTCIFYVRDRICCHIYAIAHYNGLQLPRDYKQVDRFHMVYERGAARGERRTRRGVGAAARGVGRGGARGAAQVQAQVPRRMAVVDLPDDIVVAAEESEIEDDFENPFEPVLGRRADNGPALQMY